MKENDDQPKRPTPLQQFKAAMNIQRALDEMRKRKRRAEVEKKFRNALGVRVKVG